MEQVSHAPQNTESLPIAVGSRPEPWNSVRSLLAQKPCALCGKIFKPWRKDKGNGRFSVFKENLWDKQTCCSQSCAKKFKNPMSNHQSRLKMKARLREIKHKPIKRGGNGHLLPLPQLALLHALGEGWESEVAIPTAKTSQDGYPTSYKIDIANRDKMIGIEIDGGSHCTIERRMQDAKKSDLLASLGWSMYHITNAKALELYSTFTSVDTLLILLMGN